MVAPGVIGARFWLLPFSGAKYSRPTSSGGYTALSGIAEEIPRHGAPMARFSDVQRAEIATLITNTVRNAFATNAARAQGPPGPPGPQEPPGEAVKITFTGTRWDPSKVEYFDPHLPTTYGDGNIVTVGKKKHYRNVLLFVERAKDLARVKGV